jgi:hypothetical protein
MGNAANPAPHPPTLSQAALDKGNRGHTIHLVWVQLGQGVLPLLRQVQTCTERQGQGNRGRGGVRGGTAQRAPRPPTGRESKAPRTSSVRCRS